MDLVDRYLTRHVLELAQETSLDGVMATLGLPQSDRLDRRSITNTWYFPLDGAHAGWEERVTVFEEPPGAATSLRVQHLLVAPHTGEVVKGWVVGVKDVLDAWTRRVATETAMKPAKVGANLHFQREGHARVTVSRSRLPISKAWHVVFTEVTLLPRS